MRQKKRPPRRFPILAPVLSHRKPEGGEAPLAGRFRAVRSRCGNSCNEPHPPESIWEFPYRLPVPGETGIPVSRPPGIPADSPGVRIGTVGVVVRIPTTNLYGAETAVWTGRRSRPGGLILPGRCSSAAIMIPDSTGALTRGGSADDLAGPLCVWGRFGRRPERAGWKRHGPPSLARGGPCHSFTAWGAHRVGLGGGVNVGDSAAADGPFSMPSEIRCWIDSGIGAVRISTAAPGEVTAFHFRLNEG